MNDYRVKKSMNYFILIALGSLIALMLYMYNMESKNEYNYHCKKGRLYMSVTPNSHVFKQTTEYCLDIRDEPLITEVK